MKFLFALLIILSGCQDYNSNSSDKERFGPSDLTGSDKFKEAYPILVKRCANCHEHSAWSSYKKEENWADNSLIVAGSSANSNIIIRTINTGGATSDMPQGGSALPDDEYQVLLDWIDGL